jgi:hypothetical protein
VHFLQGVQINGEFPERLTGVRIRSIVGNTMRGSKAIRNRKNTPRRRETRAASSLRKRGYIWWTHFGCKGQFFRRSLGTSDRKKAKRKAEKLIALAEAGKIQSAASSADERKDQKSASLKKSYADTKLHSAVCRRNQNTWDGMDQESRDRHSAALKAAANRPGARKLLRERSTDLWQDNDYRDRNVAAVNKGWKSQKLRKQQSKTIKAACLRPEVKAHRLAGRYRAAETLLKQRAEARDGGTARRAGRPPKDQRNREAARLKELGWSWRDIAKKLDPDFAKNPKRARNRVRVGASSVPSSKKQETPR